MHDGLLFRWFGPILELPGEGCTSSSPCMLSYLRCFNPPPPPSSYFLRGCLLPVADILKGTRSPKEGLEDLMTMPLKAEMYDA